MSWSFSKKAPQADARAIFKQAHQEQYAYQTDGNHKHVMDKIAAFAGEIADAAPPECELNLSSSGHVAANGYGSVTVTLSFYPPVAGS